MTKVETQNYTQARARVNLGIDKTLAEATRKQRQSGEDIKEELLMKHGIITQGQEPKTGSIGTDNPVKSEPLKTKVPIGESHAANTADPQDTTSEE